MPAKKTAAKPPQASFKTILFDVAGGVATLTLNRPDKLNSFNTEMHGEIRAAMKQVKRDPRIRALLITGSGRAFCAGQDLSDRAVAPGKDKPRDLGESLEKYYNPLIRTLRELEMPVVCAVNGVAAGAGANLALACDLVFAGRSARFIQAFCKIGLVPDSGGSYHLPLLVGRARAMGLALLGDALPAEQAEEWGLIWKCVDDDALMREATAAAQALAKGPTVGLALIKRAINSAATSTLKDQLALEQDLQRVAGYTADYQEGVAAFLGKRAPKYKGR
ncbi:MAG: 2-(1,2-epoxy-1,2-dihydrophenyl)acetyl-CoA isomerase PaaG [Alphaproteobacteria bacterium]|nr:2-(1,2-epoxy-1,2-dihydrophenyl)acetyl-CoA isomerase PaaG [Alphaproteobacteria bacterium]